ncbi:MAG: Endonuclease V [Candidatus Syntrophoarchaeum caldarius]|uniref:Endonuclease V n=1 Tax=Candidatus Syntropharchaeum caldarium TaxID=1838285 RepID=A0A1F2PA71_9EURY|nr:MAG: Endonuclease V [Candidatus Syntrophoarchaeum caldarius]
MVNREALYRIQAAVASRTIIDDRLNLDAIKYIAGADQAFFEDKIISAIVVLEFPALNIVDSSHVILSVNFPYIPGLLSFREAPSVIEAFNLLDVTPDLLVVDGCGINHPRFAGLATHIGVMLDIPTIGVAKKILCGKGEVPSEVGDAEVIIFQDRVVGYYFKSKRGCNPLIVAPGHMISPESALKLIKSCIKGYKLPEPTRIAHLFANRVKRECMREAKED